MAVQIKHTIARFAIIFFLIMICFAGVVAMIIYIQTSPKQEEKWKKIESLQERPNQPIPPIRGNILDANGNLLAGSLPKYIVYMDTRVEALHLGNDTLFIKYIDSIANGLSAIIGDKTPQAYKKMICNAFYSKSKNYRDHDIRLYSGLVSYIQKREIMQLPLIRRGVYKSGVYFKEQHVRKKPYGRLGSRTIGTIFQEEGTGNAGLEMNYENILHGTEGISTRMRVAGEWTDIPIVEAMNGNDVVTTLDVNLMDICENTLENKLKEIDAAWGCVLLMETHTGQIKAIINLDRQTDGSYRETLNHAVTHVEPGSTFKTIALMAAMNDNKVQLSDTFRVFKGGWKYYKLNHIDSHPADTYYTMREALAISSNIAFARMITKVYNGQAEPFVQQLDKMGITKPFACEIPGCNMDPIISVPTYKPTISLMSYGYSVELSPLHILAFYNSIANDGCMIRPYLVSRIENNGIAIETFDTEVLNPAICSPSVLKDIKEALHDVVWNNEFGTASVRKSDRMPKAQSDLVHIAGKTGTAQLIINGRYSKSKHRITFVGYFPEEAPEYTCLCMIQQPNKAYDSGYDCGGVVRQIAERTMANSWVYEIKDGQMQFIKK